jgi:hypothetical protein
VIGENAVLLRRGHRSRGAHGNGGDPARLSGLLLVTVKEVPANHANDTNKIDFIRVICVIRGPILLFRGLFHSH